MMNGFGFSYGARFRVLAVVWFFATVASAGEMSLAPIFSDHMVIASGRPLRVFGTGRGQIVAKFRGQQASVRSSDDQWCLDLPTGEVGGPFRLEVVLNGRRIEIEDVMVGEVLLFAGQSNMQFKLQASSSDPSSWADHPEIRAFSTRRLENGEPFSPDDGWVSLTATNAGLWSAVAYETAIRRAAAKNCAIGVINCYQGASTIQAWMDADLAFERRFAIPEGGALHGDSRNPNYIWNRPGTLYHAQFRSIVPYSLSHVVWYQGESNTGRREGETYAGLLAAMIEEWRTDLRDAELPFTVVQLADYRRRDDEGWKAVQDAQAQVPAKSHHVRTVKAADVCEDDDIHPKTKNRLAERIAESIAGLQGSRSSVPYTRSVSYAAKPGERRRRLDRTWIFAERQLYGGHQNLLHVWWDRPLFHDSGLRQDPLGGADAAFLRDVEVLRSVGLDGFGSLDHYPVSLRQLKRLRQRKVPLSGFSQMIVIPGYYTEKDYRRTKDMILEVARSPYTTRLDGKLVFWIYGGGEAGKHEWWAKRLHSDPDIPPFLLIGDMPLTDIYKAWNKYEWKGEPSPPDVVEKFRRDVERAIAVLDGFQIRCTEYTPSAYGEYDVRWEKAGFYRDYLLPIAKEILARPENRDKLVGTYVRQGYVNKFTGVVDGQFGTETLRNWLDEILLVNPDVLMAFEWNEVNENTHFQPTVANGKTCARVLAHYRALLDGQPFVPMAGDDVSIPNFVLSVRQAMRLGEIYHIELLYLPDGTESAEVRAQVRVMDEDGRVLVNFPVEAFSTDRLAAVNYRVPSECFPDVRAFRVELVTEGGGVRRKWSAFDSTRVDVTRCQNYLYSRHPLREQLEPADASLTVSCGPSGRLNISADVRAKEPIASFEVLADDEEVAAANGKNAFDGAEHVIFRGVLSEMDKDAPRQRKGRIALENAPGADLRSGNYAWEKFSVGKRRSDGGWDVDVRLCRDRATFLALVPKNEASVANLRIDLGNDFTRQIPLAEILKLGRKAYQSGLIRLDLSRVDDLPDIPEPLGTGSASVRAELALDSRHPMIRSRVVSSSGKVWRSAPQFPAAFGEVRRTIAVWSDSRQEPVDVSVRAERIPSFNYRFTPEYGALLPCEAGRDCWGQLGGANLYAEQMLSAFARKRVPEHFVRADPEWMECEGGYALRFDGHGSYLALAAEILPRGSTYALDFEICPDGNGDYVLLRQQRADARSVGLQLAVVSGKLLLSHFGVMMSPSHFETGLEIPNGEWAHIRIEKLLDRIVAIVNGREFSVPYYRRAHLFQGAVFGGNVEPGPGLPAGVRPFKGLLRSLSVVHAVEHKEMKR